MSRSFCRGAPTAHDPARPQAGATLTVSFGPATTGPLNLSYGFDRFRSSQVALQRKAHRLEASVALPSDAVYFWCHVEGEAQIEETYVFGPEGLPVEGARRERAATYAAGKPVPGHEAAARTLLEEELRAYPESARAWAEWWSLRYRETGQSISERDAILAEIRQLLETKPDRPRAYEAAALGYNALNRNPQAVEVMRGFVKRFPGDASLDRRILFFFGNWGTAGDMDMLPGLSGRWTASLDYWWQLVRVLDRTHAEPHRLLRAGQEWLAQLPKDQDANGAGRFQLAETWLDRGVDPKAAEQLARQAAAISELGPRPVAATAKLSRQFVVPVYRSAVGWALFQQGTYEEALKEFQRAVAVREKEDVTARALYYRLGRTFEKLGRPAEATDAYMKELAWGAFENPTRAAARNLYRKEHGSGEGLEAEFRARLNELLQRRDPAAEPVEDADEELGKFELNGPDGRTVAPSLYRGKIVVIEFWATWCGPCLKSLEHTQRLKQAFPNSIVVLAVNRDAEETRSRAVDYLKQKGYDFVLLFDDEKRRDLRPEWVPARFVLDRSGRLRVREFGWGLAPEPVFERKVRALLGNPAGGKP